MLVGCAEQETETDKETPREQFLRLATIGEGLKFVDNQLMGARVDGASCEMTFRGDSTLRVDGFGYGIDFANGTYSFEGEDVLILELEWNEPDWPRMRLSRDEGALLLQREDGKKEADPLWTFWEWAVKDFYPLRAALPDEDSESGEGGEEPGDG